MRRLRTRMWGDLKVAEAVAVPRVVGEKCVDGLEPLGNALAVVEPVHADDEAASGQAGSQARGLGRCRGIGRIRRECLRVDADGEDGSLRHLLCGTSIGACQHQKKVVLAQRLSEHALPSFI